MGAFALFLAIHRMGDCNCELTQYLLKKRMTANACFKETHLEITLKILGQWKSPSETMIVPIKFMAASAPLK